MDKKKVLIIGSSAKEYAVAKYLSKNPAIEKIYVAPGNFMVSEFAERVDIREDAVQELLEFVVNNSVDLTVACSQKAIKADVAGFFQANSQLIFAPTAASSVFTISRSFAKKFLYKLHVPTPKFGVFEKCQIALDYVKTAKIPLLITSDEDTETSVKAVCATVTQAKTCITDLFMRNESKVVIEDYSYGHSFCLYVMTDGYKAIPFAVTGDYKFLEDGDAGLFTLGVGAYVPDYKVSFDVVNSLMGDVVYPVLNNLEKRGNPYLGILGIECVLGQDGSYVVTGFTPFLKDHDTQAVLDTLDTNLYSLMEACAIGSFADDYEDIRINDLSVISCVLSARSEDKVITGLDLVDESAKVSYFGVKKNNYMDYLTNKGRTLVLTQSAYTLSRARELLYSNIEEINFEGKKYRHDICAE